MTTATIATEVKHIPLSKLKPSPNNVRKTGADAGLDEFAASIAAHGLLQPLVVTPERSGEGGETGSYLVTAGERRRKALKILAKQKRIKRTEPIPCLVKADGIASEISLAENVIRTNMHPADQFEAFYQLHEEHGLGIEEIAARFSITPAVVKQRLKLAAVSPALMARYREGELTLDQLMAFTLTDDHGRQHEVWAQLSWNKSPEMIRKLLTQSHVGPSDRRVRFVGAEAYEAAGGTILRDLFVEDHGGYFTDCELLDRLVLEKLEMAANEVVREGWKWVEVYAEYPYSYTQAMRRMYPQSVPLTEEASEKLDELVARHDTLSAEQGEDAPDDVAAKLDRLAEEIAAIQQGSESYQPEDLSRAGAIVSLSPDGTLRVERGLIKPEDAPQPSPSDQAASPGDSGPTSGPTGHATGPGGANGAEMENGKVLSNQLMESLTAHRTAALQECLAAKPDAALIAVVHALALRVFYRQEFGPDSCLGLETKVAEPSSFAPHIHESPAGQSLARRHEDWARKLPTDRGELWDSVVSQDAETLLALLAYCAARTIDAVHRSWERGSRGLRHSDQLALTLELDMAAWWAPTRENYLALVSKAQILEAVREGVSKKDSDSLAGLNARRSDNESRSPPPPFQPTSESSAVGRAEEYMALSKSEREAKLKRLAELEGFETVDQMFDAAVNNSVCPGICINPSCDYTTEVEPDQRKGYCENCGTQTVKSCLILAGINVVSRIKELNDAFRTTFEGGQVLVTAGVGALPPILASEALQKVRTFTDFTPDNDPHDEHDVGRFELAGRTFLWKIDYYNKSMTCGSENPADPEQTTRVLTIMLSEDY